MRLETIASAVINSKHGWAVAEQFESTFSGESFEEQNNNALGYIHNTLVNLISSDVLNEDATEELSEYVEKLGEYLM